MVIRAYSYHTRCVTALLDEAEWTDFGPMVRGMIEGVKAFRSETKVNLAEALVTAPSVLATQDYYFQLTGDNIEHPNLLWHVRAASYGRLCPDCEKPFRTPKAKICVECGHQLPPGQLAGPLTQSETKL